MDIRFLTLAAVLPHYGYQTGETAPEAHTAKFNELFCRFEVPPFGPAHPEDLDPRAS